MKIGTRSSAMAIAQTEEIVARLRRKAGVGAEMVRFQPRGDVDQTSRLDRHGGKGGAFVTEIREAVRAGEIAAAMHSLKDVPGDEEAPGLVLAAYLAREAPEDALVVRPGLTEHAVAASAGAGLRIGTNSVRRAAYIRRLFPSCEVIHYRGAADTRVRKLDGGELQRLPGGGAVGPADALVMAKSGLERVGLGGRIARVFSPAEMLPAVGQGIVTVECAASDWGTRALLSAIDDEAARACALAEREMLWILNGHCNAPIAGHAVLIGDRLELAGAVLSLNGAVVIETRATGPKAAPREIGRRAGLDLIAKGAADLIRAAGDV